MLLLEVLVQLVRDLATFFLVTRLLVVFGIDFGERFLRLSVLKFEVTRGKERVRIDSTPAFYVVKVILSKCRPSRQLHYQRNTHNKTHVKDPLLDQIFNALGRFFRDNRCRFAHSFEL